MKSEYELIKQFVEEHKGADYFIPEDNIILMKVADTPNFIREYFEWKGELRAVDALRKIAEDIKNGKRYPN